MSTRLNVERFIKRVDELIVAGFGVLEALRIADQEFSSEEREKMAAYIIERTKEKQSNVEIKRIQ